MGILLHFSSSVFILCDCRIYYIGDVCSLIYTPFFYPLSFLPLAILTCNIKGPASTSMRGTGMNPKVIYYRTKSKTMDWEQSRVSHTFHMSFLNVPHSIRL
jgi:hypothetical protein